MLNYTDEIFLWTLCKHLVINVKNTLFHLQNTTLDYKIAKNRIVKNSRMYHTAMLQINVVGT